jgi:membrane protease YdiL (CAAX protease family)
MVGTALAASAWVWIRWQRSNALGQDFWGPRDVRSATVKPWGHVVLLGFLGMLVIGALSEVLYSKISPPLSDELEAGQRLLLLVERLRWNALTSTAVLGMLLGFSYWQVHLTHGEERPWQGLIPTGRDLRNGVLLTVACVPLMLALQAILQYVTVQVFGMPQVQHPLIELLIKNKDAAPDIINQLFLWATCSVVILAPLSEEILFRGLLQGWLRVKYQTMANRILGTPAETATATTSVVEIQRRRLTTWAPIVISSMAFSLAHVGHGPALIPLFFFSLALGYVYEKTGRLAPVVIAHSLQNLINTVLLWLMISGRIPAE